jgi:hypothetical protein
MLTALGTVVIIILALVAIMIAAAIWFGVKIYRSVTRQFDSHTTYYPYSKKKRSIFDRVEDIFEGDD